MSRSMKMWIAGLILSLGLGGCSVSTWYNPAPGEVTPGKSVDLTDKSPSFREGYEEGCSTAQGEYKKSSERFNSDTEYHDGWFAGRAACQGT